MHDSNAFDSFVWMQSFLIWDGLLGHVPNVIVQKNYGFIGQGLHDSRYFILAKLVISSSRKVSAI